MFTHEEFEKIVEEALSELPKQITQKIENIDILIEETPTLEIQQKMKISKDRLLGLYSGIPLNERSPFSYGNVLPDRIYLFKKNLEALCHSPNEIKVQIQKTILHEIGHYFGLTDHRLRELGY